MYAAPPGWSALNGFTSKTHPSHTIKSGVAETSSIENRSHCLAAGSTLLVAIFFVVVFFFFLGEKKNEGKGERGRERGEEGKEGGKKTQIFFFE